MRECRPKDGSKLSAVHVQGLVRPALQSGILILVPSAGIAVLFPQSLHQAVGGARQLFLDGKLYDSRRQLFPLSLHPVIAAVADLCGGGFCVGTFLLQVG